MRRGMWKETVTFETRKIGQYRTIASAEEAAGALMGEWPLEDGKALRKACEACLDAMDGRGNPEAARKAFLRAAEEAGIFVR